MTVDREFVPVRVAEGAAAFVGASVFAAAAEVYVYLVVVLVASLMY